MSEGLFHLGGMATLVGVAYLNFERPGELATPLLENIELVREEIRSAIVELDQKPSVFIEELRRNVPSSLFNNLEAAFLLFVAKKPLPPYDSWLTFQHIVHRTWCKPPGERYFHYGWHGLPVAFLTLLSLSAFIDSIYIAVFPKPIFFLNWATEQNFFWLFVATLVWTFISLLISRQLNSLSQRCKRYLDRLKSQVKADKQAASDVAETVIETAFQKAEKHPPPHE